MCGELWTHRSFSWAQLIEGCEGSLSPLQGPSFQIGGACTPASAASAYQTFPDSCTVQNSYVYPEE